MKNEQGAAVFGAGDVKLCSEGRSGAMGRQSAHAARIIRCNTHVDADACKSTLVMLVLLMGPAGSTAASTWCNILHFAGVREGLIGKGS
jgi:hypothetical protein